MVNGTLMENVPHSFAVQQLRKSGKTAVIVSSLFVFVGDLEGDSCHTFMEPLKLWPEKGISECIYRVSKGSGSSIGYLNQKEKVVSFPLT